MTSSGDVAAWLLKAPSLGGAGLLATAYVTLARRQRHKTWLPPLFTMLSAFLAGTSLPYGLALIAYPFVQPAPDLTPVASYLPFAGIALLWAGFYGMREAASIDRRDRRDDQHGAP